MILNFWSWWLRALVSTIPPYAVEWVIGPRGALRVTASGVVAENVRRFRPCDVLVDEVSVLRQTHSLPAEAASDFRAAIELNIETTTPFSARDVLVGTQVCLDSHSPGLRRVDVAIVPVRLINDALLANGATWGQVRSVMTTDEPFISLALRKRRWSLPAITSTSAIVVGLAGLLIGGVSHYVANLNVISELDASLQELRPRVVELVAEAQARTEGQQMVASADTATPFSSLTSALLALSDALPRDAEILRLDLRTDGLRIGIRAGDVMTVIGELRGRLASWEVVADGSLQVDPATNLEIGAALIRGLS